MHNELSRREVIKAATGLAGLAGCTTIKKPVRTTDKPNSPNWIDAHVHVWTDNEEKYPRIDRYKGVKMNPVTFTPQELFAHCKPCGVRRINLIQMSCYGSDNSYMLDMMEQYPGTFAGTAIIDVTTKDVADTMRRLGTRGVRAFRIFPALAQRQPVDWLKPVGYRTMFKTAGHLNQAVSCLIGPDSLPELDRMCTQFPETPVIIDHLCRIGVRGQINQQEADALCRMSRHKQIMVKVGAFYALGKKKLPYTDLLPFIQQVVEAFGPKRCMWESDSPFQITRGGSYEASLALIRDSCDFLSPTDKKQILRKTAEAFFFHNA